MPDSVRELTTSYLSAMSAKELDAASAIFATDAVVADPLFPWPVMTGIEQIRAGLAWAFRGMESLEFDLGREFAAGDAAAFEVQTTLTLKPRGAFAGGRLLVVDAPAGQITKLTAYGLCEPGGGASMALRAGHRVYRALNRRR